MLTTVEFSWLDFREQDIYEVRKYSNYIFKTSYSPWERPVGGVLVKTNFGLQFLITFRRVPTFFKPLACCNIFPEQAPKNDESAGLCWKCQSEERLVFPWTSPVSQHYATDRTIEHFASLHLDVFESILVSPFLERKINRIVQGKCLLEPSGAPSQSFLAMLAKENGILTPF